MAVIQIAKGETRSAEEAMMRAQEVVTKLKAGEAFAALAAEYSDDPTTAKNGGDLGMFESGFFGETFDSTVASLADGEFSARLRPTMMCRLSLSTKVRLLRCQRLSLRNAIVADLQLIEAENIFLAQLKS